jgi:hypothetical protein
VNTTQTSHHAYYVVLAAFATVYQVTQRYSSTYTLLSLVAALGVLALTMCKAAERRGHAPA